MKSYSLAAILMLTTASQVFALDNPPPGAADPHMREVAYNPMNRTLLIGEIGMETTITFSPDEQIARVNFGMGDGGKDDPWEGPDPAKMGNQPLMNVLPLWPHKEIPTNLQVTTVRPDQSRRVYQFALQARKPPPDGADDPDATFGLKFDYPAEVKKQAVATWRAQKEKADRKTAEDRLSSDIYYGDRNWSYVGRPNKAWRDNGWPRPEVSDNGMLTAFKFVGNIPDPAIYIVDTPKCGPGGTERLAPFSDRDELKVVSTRAQHFRLRLGNAVMEVCNKAWDAGVGQNPQTGTTSPDVVREVISAR